MGGLPFSKERGRKDGGWGKRLGEKKGGRGKCDGLGKINFIFNAGNITQWKSSCNACMHEALDLCVCVGGS